MLGGLCRNPGGLHGRAAESEVFFTRSTAEAKFRLQDETSTTDTILVLDFFNETSIV